jgi:membrane protease YdiL (CAAX protease family)
VTQRRSKGTSSNKALTSYWERTQWPLQSLLFLLPLLVIYEFGAFFYAPESHDRLPRIYAESLLNQFFELFGVTGYHLPAIAVVVVLFCWHLARRDPWKPEPRLWGVMALESIVLALPLFVFMLVLFRQPAVQAANVMLAGTGLEPQFHSWQSGAVLMLGAGIYEELVFRLIAIALLHMLLVDLLTVPEPYGAPLTVVLSALAFALYHFDISSTADVFAFQPAQWSRFAFYMLAGMYLAAVYMLRGFGLAAGAHAAYDLIVVTMDFMNDGGGA